MELLLAIVIVVIVGAFVTAPLRRRAGGEVDTTDAELAELEARKRAKYREIRDAEADHAAGKLTDEDFRRLNRELRGEAIEILKRIDRLRLPGRSKSASD